MIVTVHGQQVLGTNHVRGANEGHYPGKNHHHGNTGFITRPKEDRHELRRDARNTKCHGKTTGKHEPHGSVEQGKSLVTFARGEKSGHMGKHDCSKGRDYR